MTTTTTTTTTATTEPGVDAPTTHLFDSFTRRGVTLRNRVAMSPMCMFSCGEEGESVPTSDFHFTHLTSRALGGCGLIIAEATAVQSVGRIAVGDTGLWNDEQAQSFGRISRYCKKVGAAFGIQIGHAGRKAWSFTAGFDGPEDAIAPSALPYDSSWKTPREMTTKDIDDLVESFGAAAARARHIVDCDLLEIHAAHGYLLHNFLSPISNQRTDEYGGSLENRVRVLKRVYDAVRSNFGEDRMVWVRISATEWVDAKHGPSWTVDDSVELSKMMKEWGVDVVDVSSGANSPLQEIVVGPGYQVPFAERIRKEAQIPVAAVGMITEPEQAEKIIASGQADIVVLGRELLRDPFWALRAAKELKQEVTWPRQYMGAKQ